MSSLTYDGKHTHFEAAMTMAQASAVNSELLRIQADRSLTTTQRRHQFRRLLQRIDVDVPPQIQAVNISSWPVEQYGFDDD